MWTVISDKIFDDSCILLGKKYVKLVSTFAKDIEDYENYSDYLYEDEQQTGVVEIQEVSPEAANAEPQEEVEKAE